MDRMLRHKPTGVLYVYQPAFAMRDDFEEVIDVEAREIKDPTPAPRSRKVADAPTPPAVDDTAVSADASRGLP